MPITINKKLASVILSLIFFIGLASAFQRASSYIAEKDSYIEVNGPSIAYVPRTAMYVKYNGKVKKIAKFAATVSDTEKDCNCPKCCDGHCYVIIYTDSVPISTPIRILYILWIDC